MPFELKTLTTIPISKQQPAIRKLIRLLRSGEMFMCNLFYDPFYTSRLNSLSQCLPLTASCMENQQTTVPDALLHRSRIFTASRRTETQNRDDAYNRVSSGAVPILIDYYMNIKSTIISKNINLRGSLIYIRRCIASKGETFLEIVKFQTKLYRSSC